MICKGYGKISGLVSLVKVDGLEILDELVNLVILVNLVLQVNLASLAKLVNLAQQPCALINFPVSFFLLVTFPLVTSYLLLSTSSLLLITFSLLPSPFYLEKATTPSPFIPSINMRKGCSKRTCLTCCVSSTAGMASRISLRKRPSGMLVSIVK